MRARTFLFGAAIVAFSIAALVVVAGIVMTVHTHAAATVIPAVLIKAFGFLMAGAAALVLCAIDQKLEVLTCAEK